MWIGEHLDRPITGLTDRWIDGDDRGKTFIMRKGVDTNSGRQVSLTPEQKTAAAELRARHEAIMADFRADKDVSKRIPPLGDLALRLHVSLKVSGQEPRHDKHLVTNRGVKVTDPEFYRHVHAVESLLRFIDDTEANDDRPDLSLGHEFVFKMYTRRFSHHDSYRMTRTATGWIAGHLTSIATGRDGRVNGEDGTGIFDFIRAETANYPAGLPGYFEWLWERAADGMSVEEVQQAMTQLAEWTSECERTSPGGVFEGYA